MMIDTASVADSETSTFAHWPSVAADHYLDARCPTWQAHEQAGRVRYARRVGASHSRVYIDPLVTEILGLLLPTRPAPLPGPEPPGAGRVEEHRGSAGHGHG